MIDVNSERVISLTEAASLLPRRRGGRKPHVSCLYRWTQAGCRGIRLESVQVGGTRCTSREALARFFERLGSTTADAPAAAFDTTHAKRVARAERELDRLG